ncbi:MAG: peptidylprolyl isomerase [Chthoniobacterales bacterium]
MIKLLVVSGRCIRVGDQSITKKHIQLLTIALNKAILMMKAHSIILIFVSFLILFITGCATNEPQPTRLQPTGPQVAVMLIKMPKEKNPERVVLSFREDTAPQTVANFKTLASKHYYDGMTFHRLFAHSLVQTGDPTSRHGESSHSGTGGPGYTLPAEIRLPHDRGSIAASRLPDKINPLRRSNGSQFYICLEPMPQLNGQYTVFGKVTEGLDLLDKISMLRTNSNSFPIEKVVIVSVRMEPTESRKN